MFKQTPIITFIIDDFIIEPLGIMYLSAMLKQNGYAVDLLKTSELENTVIETPIVAYSVTTGKHRHYVEINRHVKKNTQILSLFLGGLIVPFSLISLKNMGLTSSFAGRGLRLLFSF